MASSTSTSTSTFVARAARLLRVPSVHFAVFGLLLFLVSRFFAGPEAADRQRIVVPAARLSEAERTFQVEAGRPPDAAEKVAIAEKLIDEEILFRHALALGLHHAEAPRQRLASIAAFVEPPGSSAAPAELAERAVALGLHEGDFVTRRVLVDAAARLIRAAARLKAPTEAELAAFFVEHAELFRGEPSLRISQLLLSPGRRKEPEQEALALLLRLRREGTPLEAALVLGDPGQVPAQLPLLTERGLERRFDPDFVKHLAELPAGIWSGPISSRHGIHLVFVQERQPGVVPQLEAAREQVLALWHEVAAERWLSERLRELRGEYEIVLEREVTV